jgi:hypothetical protein
LSPDGGAANGNVGQAGAIVTAGSPGSAGSIAAGGAGAADAGGALGIAGFVAEGGNLNIGGSVAVAGSDAGGAAGDCYSPTQNTSTAYQSGSHGCPCDPTAAQGVCIGGTALVCSNGKWAAVQDGPCWIEPPPKPPPTYTIASCAAAGGYALASTGSTQTASACPSGTSLGRIDPVSSGWLDGGLCCAGFSNPGKSCGARSGDTCASDEYCAYTAGQLCGAADASSFCRTRPVACSELYAPVCGCDRKTYDNSCVANAAGAGIYTAGACAQAN